MAPASELHGVPVGTGEHVPLVPVAPGEASLQQLKLMHDALVEKVIPTKAGLYTPVASPYTPEALQAIPG